MRIENYFDLNGNLGISGLFYAEGSFGIVDGTAKYERITQNGNDTFVYCDSAVRLESEFSARKNGLVVRRDKLRNISEGEIEIYSLLSRFSLTGNNYEIYTQYNSWQHESGGSWQRLVTQITAAALGVRTCEGAAPVMGFFDLYSQKSTVFHLIPNAQWQMTAKKVAQSDRERVILETGFYDRSLCLRVGAGECIELPTIVFFTAESKTDLDAYKLHEWYLKEYPRRTTPIMYNSWLYCFDQLNIDDLICQADCAADMGFEAFMIDAGWFGTGANWWNEVGDWEENTVSFPCGRLCELSQRVRDRGMTFGLWFEPERAASGSRALRDHPEFFTLRNILDFSNPRAVDYIFDVISAQIDKYNIGCLKFDFNDNIPSDPQRNAFYRYMQGQKDFISRLRARYPELYIINCASGGYRMELGQGIMFDSFWLSDNQGPYEGIRIVKDTLKRMPSSLIERWNVQKYCEDFPVYPDKRTGRMIHCNNATWDFLIGVKDSFSESFMHGGPMGFSCDLASFPAKYKNRWSDVIKQYKEDRAFYQNAAARVLIDSDDVIAIEYADSELSTCVIQIFTKESRTKNLIIYPAVDVSSKYRYEDALLDGADIKENGIYIQDPVDNSCRTIKLVKE